jgi:hypothetical protein
MDLAASKALCTGSYQSEVHLYFYIHKFLFSVFRVLGSVFCILYSVFCIQYPVFCIQYPVFCICVLCSVFCVLCSVFRVLYSVFCSVCSEFYVHHSPKSSTPFHRAQKSQFLGPNSFPLAILMKWPISKALRTGVHINHRSINS